MKSDCPAFGVMGWLRRKESPPARLRYEIYHSRFGIRAASFFGRGRWILGLILRGGRELIGQKKENTCDLIGIGAANEKKARPFSLWELAYC